MIGKIINFGRVTTNRVRYRYFDHFIFIHINKTGGSSVAWALKLPFEHLTALEKIEIVGSKRWDKCLTFAIIRNPWDKIVSQYHYRLKTNQTDLKEIPISFSEWIYRAFGEKDPLYYDFPKMFMPQTEWIADADGRILVDEIVRFENLDEDFNRVMQKLGKRVTLPHLRQSKHDHYRDYYDTETAAIIHTCFKKDIDNFGYTF